MMEVPGMVTQSARMRQHTEKRRHATAGIKPRPSADNFKQTHIMKTISSDSLGGKNGAARATGARSSRARSTMFKKLQRLDRKISKLDRMINYGSHSFPEWKNYRKELFNLGYPNLNYDKTRQKRAELDQKRRDIRLQRKAHSGLSIPQ